MATGITGVQTGINVTASPIPPPPPTPTTTLPSVFATGSGFGGQSVVLPDWALILPLVQQYFP